MILNYWSIKPFILKTAYMCVYVALVPSTKTTKAQTFTTVTVAPLENDSQVLQLYDKIKFCHRLFYDIEACTFLFIKNKLRFSLPTCFSFSSHLRCA